MIRLRTIISCVLPNKARLDNLKCFSEHEMDTALIVNTDYGKRELLMYYHRNIVEDTKFEIISLDEFFHENKKAILCNIFSLGNDDFPKNQTKWRTLK